MPLHEPRLSVVIPNYNHAQYLPRCLTALLEQSVPPAEIIVVDDASTDHSRDVLSAFAARHPLLRLCPNERNLGVHHSLNRGLAVAQGDYVFFGAADDEVRPGLFEHSLRVLRDHPEAGLSSGVCEWRCASTGLSWFMGAGMPNQPCYLSPADLVALGRRGRLAISAPTALYKKSALMEAGAWIPELRWHCDFFGTYVVAFRQGICHLPETLATFNLHPNSYYHSARSQAERRDVLELMLQLIGSGTYADVAPRIRASGILGVLGGPMLRLALGRRRHWPLLNPAFVRQAARRSAEVVGRRFFPDWLARLCLKTFYGRTTR